MNKTAVLIGVVILISGLIYGLLRLMAQPPAVPQASPETSPEAAFVIDQFTVGWQEYKNDQLGFQLKYPADWKYLPPATFSKDGAYFKVSVELVKFQNLSDYPIIEDLQKDGYEKIDLETANGKAKLMLTNHNDKDLANMFLIHNGYFYRLTWNAVPELRDQYAETFKQMVASFKFL